MPHCQKEFSKPPVSSKQKKAQQQAKKAKKGKQEDEEEEEDPVRAQEERERIAAEWEAELARTREAERREEEKKRLKAAQAKGTKACKAGRWAEALEHYSECVELEPEDYIHWSNRAEVHKHLANFEEMLADGAHCTTLNPEYAKGWARVGGANVALARLEAAEEAFQRGLALEPENAVCLKGLKDIERAREEPTEERVLDNLVKDLQKLDATRLRARALEDGVDEAKVEEAEKGGDLVRLIVAHKYLVDLIAEELRGLEPAQLRARALEEGLAEEAVTEAADLDDPVGALTALIVKYLANDLVDAVTEHEAEAAEDEESDDSDDDTADIDCEVVTLDEDDMQLAVGDVFLAGAYMDENTGELVMPNGTRLGHRSLNMFYKQRVRPTSNRQLAVKSMSRLHAKVAHRDACRLLVRNAQIGLKSAIASQHGFKQNQPDNKALRAIVHHWGGGGGGAHYMMAGSKQYNKGNKVKGVVLRHSRQGAKLQAARNKTNRGNKSVACLQ